MTAALTAVLGALRNNDLLIEMSHGCSMEATSSGVDLGGTRGTVPQKNLGGGQRRYYPPQYLPPPTEGGYVFGPVCLSVCPSDYSQTCERILTKFCGGVGHGSRAK